MVPRNSTQRNGTFVASSVVCLPYHELERVRGRLLSDRRCRLHSACFREVSFHPQGHWERAKCSGIVLLALVLQWYPGWQSPTYLQASSSVSPQMYSGAKVQAECWRYTLKFGTHVCSTNPFRPVNVCFFPFSFSQHTVVFVFWEV